MPLDFVLPPIHDNADGSWGPSTSALPAQFKDIPYAPFSKSDKITRIADWHEQPADAGRGGRTNASYANQNRRAGREAYGASESNVFGYVHDEDEKSFSLVDSGRAANSKPRGMPMRARGTGRGGAGGFSSLGNRGGAGGRGGRGFQPRGGFATRGGRGGGRGGYNDWNKPQRVRDSSVTIAPEWQMLEEIEFSRLSKLSLNVEAPESLESHGTIQGYEKAFDRINTRAEKPLDVVGRVRYNISTSDDPIINRLATSGETKSAKIFATDSILSVLMCAPRSVNSWDIIFTHRDGQVFLDKREGGTFDFITVNENAQDPPADSDDPNNINSAASLSLEATYINQNFAAQIIAEGSKAYTPSPNPFYSAEDETEPLASCLYRYRKFDLSVGEGDEMDLIVRTEVDAYQGKKDSYVTVKALNEFDPRASGSSARALDWKKNLDTQKGAIVAGEMKNNSAKLARWAVQSVIAGADQMKMGYITRANLRDAQRHVIVGVQTYKPVDFARQMNISLANGWGIVRTLSDLVLRQPEGKYVLVKDPNSTIIRLYSVPENAFDAEEEEDEE